MYTILFFILLLLPFVLFFTLKSIFKREQIFLKKSIEQLDFEKELLKKEVKKNLDKNASLEKEILKSNKSVVEMQENVERVNSENEALRKLLSELQKNNKSKNDDITIEYLVQK